MRIRFARRDVSAVYRALISLQAYDYFPERFANRAESAYRLVAFNALDLEAALR